MKAILIEEERFAEICDLMRAESKSEHMIERIKQQYGVTQSVAEGIADQIHRTMHFYFVRWAQSHGASCVHH
jgi:hypothetical protein